MKIDREWLENLCKAAEQLPSGYEIEIKLSADECAIELVNPDGEELHVDSEGNWIESALYVAQSDATEFQD